MRQRIPRTLGLRHPDFLQFPFGCEIHFHRVGLGVVHHDNRRIFLVDGVINRLNIAERNRPADVTILEKRLHFLRRNLVVMLLVIDFFDGKRLSDDVRHTNRRIVEIDTDFVAEQLPPLAPDNRVLVHRHTGILRTIHHRVAHGLHIVAIGANVLETVDFPIGGIGVEVKRVDFDAVAVHIERVALRKILYQGAFRGETRACLFVVDEVVAVEFVFVLQIDVNHVAEGLAVARFVVVEKAVTRDGFLLIDHRRASVHLRLVGFRVEKAVFGVDGAALRSHFRRSDNVGNRLLRVVVERVGGDEAVTVVEFHVVEENGLSRLGVVLSPVGNEVVLAIDEFSAIDEIGRVVESVVGQAVGVECLPTVLQDDILARRHQFFGTVVSAFIAGQRERVALLETHVSEGLHRVRRLVVIGAVAPQMGALMDEMDATLGNLHVGIGSVEVVAQHIGVVQIDLIVFRCPFFRFSDGRGRKNQAKSEETQNRQKRNSVCPGLRNMSENRCHFSEIDLILSSPDARNCNSCSGRSYARRCA